MGHKSWKAGYDFESGRQTYKAQRDFGRSFSPPDSIAAILIVLFFLICFVGMGLNAVSDKIDANNRRIEQKCIEDEIKEWALKTGLIDEVVSYKNCAKKENVWLIAYDTYSHKGKVWAVVGINGQCQDVTTFILYRSGRNDNWEVQWQSDLNKIKRDLNKAPSWEIQPYIEPKYIIVTDEYAIKGINIIDRWRVYMEFVNIGPRYSNRKEETAILYTIDAGMNWEFYFNGGPGWGSHFR